MIRLLRLGKAPGSDEITNLIIQAGGDRLAQALSCIATASLTLGLFPSKWKVARTVILRKPHKPDYTDPTAYRPIALLSCLGKVVESMIANRFKSVAEANNVLPSGHYGGRPQRATEDALTHLKTWTKNQWSKGRFVGALFMDVKAAFPTVNPTRLVDTLRRQRFCPTLTTLISSYLTGRSTTIAFGDFESAPKRLNIGLPQGSPLSVILYILYNASLLTQAADLADTSSLGFIDDVAFITADRSLNKVRRRLQILANRELQWGRRHGAAFDRKKSQWMVLTHKPLPDQLPVLQLGDETLLPQQQVKWLGVIIDQKLTFTSHGRAVEKKGVQVALQLARLARTGWGIPLTQCMQLITSLIHSRTDYAASIWYQVGKNTATVKAIQRIDNIAQRFALGVFRTHPLVFLKHDTASPSAIARLDSRAQKAVARLLTLPDTNPAAVLARAATGETRKAHRSGLHHALHSPSSVLASLPNQLEIISAQSAQMYTPHARILPLIPPTKAAAAFFVKAQLGPHTKELPTRSIAFSDGSLFPGEGIGAAAHHLPSGTVSPANLGDPDFHTVYEAELVGIRLAAELAISHRTRLCTSFWFFIDNQSSIRALTQQLRPTPGLSLRQRALDVLTTLADTSPFATVRLVWCPAHIGIQENEDADEAAKEATRVGQPQHLPLSLAAVKQRINARCSASVTSEPQPPVLRRLRVYFNPTATRSGLAALARHDATAVAQLRAGHSPLSAFLYRINAVESPNCSECAQPETPEHFILLCRKYEQQRRRLLNRLRELKIGCMLSTILTNPKAYRPLADYVTDTARFLQARQWQPPPTPIPTGGSTNRSSQLPTPRSQPTQPARPPRHPQSSQPPQPSQPSQPPRTSQPSLFSQPSQPSRPSQPSQSQPFPPAHPSPPSPPSHFSHFSRLSHPS